MSRLRAPWILALLLAGPLRAEVSSPIRANGQASSREIDQRRQSTAPQADDSRLEQQANQLAHSILNRHLERVWRYDLETGHGNTLGARLGE